MLNLFVLKVTRIVIGAVSYQRKVSVHGNGSALPVTLRQTLIRLSHNSIIRVVKQGCKSQLNDFTCINSKYKAVFIVESGLQATWLSGLSCTSEANHSRRPVFDPGRQAIQEPRIFLHERPQ